MDIHMPQGFFFMPMAFCNYTLIPNFMTGTTLELDATYLLLKIKDFFFILVMTINLIGILMPTLSACEIKNIYIFAIVPFPEPLMSSPIVATHPLGQQISI
jgi:hypothetical protein